MQYVDKTKTRIVNFELIKETTYIDKNTARNITYNLDRLLECKNEFKVNIPHFEYTVVDTTVIITNEYIKGIQLLRETDRRRFSKLVWNDLVKRKDLFSLANYGPENFILDSTNYKNIYMVDVEDFRDVPIDQRIQRFDQHFRCSDQHGVKF